MFARLHCFSWLRGLAIPVSSACEANCAGETEGHCDEGGRLRDGGQGSGGDDDQEVSRGLVRGDETERVTACIEVLDCAQWVCAWPESSLIESVRESVVRYPIIVRAGA